MRRLIRCLGAVALGITPIAIASPAQAATVSIVHNAGPQTRLSGVDTASAAPLVSYAVSEPLDDTGRVYRTADGGLTWTLLSTSPAGEWVSVATSSNGSTIVIVGRQGTNPVVSSVYRSTDSGATWTSVGPSTNAVYTDVEMSDDGTVVAFPSNAGVFVSRNFTAQTPTWAPPTMPSWGGPEPVEEIAMSASGAIIYGAKYGSQIHKSLDYGATWILIGLGVNSWEGVATSADGQDVIFITRNTDPTSSNAQGVYSTNTGGSWTQVSNIGGNFVANQAVDVAMSPDGNTVVAASYDGKIMISNDSGSTFADHGPTTGPWTRVSVSNSVNNVLRFTIATENQGLRSSMPTPAPVVNSVSEMTGPSAGGTTVSLFGQFFYDIQDITFGGVSGTNIVRTSDTLVDVTTPPGTPGNAAIVIITDHGSFTVPNPFVYLAPPPVFIPPTAPPATTTPPILNVVLPDGGPGPSNSTIQNLPNGINYISNNLTPWSYSLTADLDLIRNDYVPVISSMNSRQFTLINSTYDVYLSNCKPYESIVISLHSDPTVLARVTADENGDLATTVRLPSGVTGDHTLVVYAPESGEGFAVPLTISAPELPATGSNGGSAVVALWILTVGLGITLVTRHRQLPRTPSSAT